MQKNDNVINRYIYCLSKDYSAVYNIEALLARQAAHGDMDSSVQTDWCGCVAGQRPS